ncbi:hypothetical protein HDU77_006521 [Chytriomyces hyalinus]|nr:hypothetical protein HDU77_006521 [Chytriomyces hyalinus]
MAFINPYLTKLNLQSQAGIESAAAPVQDYRWTQDCGPIVIYGGTSSAAALNSTHTLQGSRASLSPSSSGSPPPFLLLQSAHYEVEEEPESVPRPDSDLFVLGSLADEENHQQPLLSTKSSFSSVYDSVSGSVAEMPAPHFAGTSAYALQHADSLAEMEEFLALMDTWPTGPDFPHRDNWLLKPRDIPDDEPNTPDEAQLAVEAEPVFSADGYSISYRRRSLLSSASPYSLSAYPTAQQVQDYFVASRVRNLQGCGAGMSPNPFARPKGMGEHHMLPMESDVAYARLQTAADQCELEIEEETAAEDSVDTQDNPSCPSTALNIETMHQQGRFTARDDGLLNTPKDQHSQDLPPLCPTQASNYGTVPAVTSTGFFAGGESDGNADGMIAAAMGKRKYLHWLCDGSDFD